MMEGERARPESSDHHAAPLDEAKQRLLSPAARRALDEAAERRTAQVGRPAPPERGGRAGLEPVRYGDWEVKGLASDF